VNALRRKRESSVSEAKESSTSEADMKNTNTEEGSAQLSVTEGVKEDVEVAPPQAARHARKKIMNALRRKKLTAESQTAPPEPAVSQSSEISRASPDLSSSPPPAPSPYGKEEDDEFLGRQGSIPVKEYFVRHAQSQHPYERPNQNMWRPDFDDEVKPEDKKCKTFAPRCFRFVLNWTKKCCAISNLHSGMPDGLHTVPTDSPTSDGLYRHQRAPPVL